MILLKIICLALPFVAASFTLQSNQKNGDCTLPLHFTYFQRDGGYYCRSPTAFLEASYGGSFSEPAQNRETSDPNVYFTIKEVEEWRELESRIAQLDDTVDEKGYGLHTPSLFWDGRNDLYFHANFYEDTISTKFRPVVDAYIADCLKVEPTTADGTGNDIGEITDNEKEAGFEKGDLTVEVETQEGDQQSEEEPKDTPGNGGIDEDGCAIDSSNEYELSNYHADYSTNIEETEASGHSDGPCFVFFFSSGCQHCEAVDSFIREDLTEESGLTFQFHSYNVLSSGHSKDLLSGYARFGWTGERAVPTIFIGSEHEMRVLVGEKVIMEELPPLLSEANETLECYDFGVVSQADDESASTSDIQWGVLTAAALVDSINPCAIAVLVILLSGLVLSVVPPQNEHQQEVEADGAQSSHLHESIAHDDSSECTNRTDEGSIGPGYDEERNEVVATVDLGSSPNSTIKSPGHQIVNNSEQEQQEEEEAATPRPTKNNTMTNEQNNRARRAFISGMAFILSIFIAYYAMGFGIFAAVSSTGVSNVVLLVLGIFVIILGLWNIKDFFCYNQGPNVEIPRSWRPALKKVLGAVTSPIGAFAAGFLVCLFELPCTGGPYLFILGLLADKNTRTEAAFVLLYYNFIFVLPLICINCLVYFGVTMVQQVGIWKDKYIRYLHLFAGVVLIALGALAITDYYKPLF